MKAVVDVIEILDDQNHLVFRWNPVGHLGADAVNPKYLQTSIAADGSLDWSHANSVCWDWDGNILYSFMNIGIGKIGAVDGQFIWHFESKHGPYINGSDTLAINLGHGLENIRHHDVQGTYVIFNSGDALHPQSHGLQFSVDNFTAQISNVTKATPLQQHHISSGGNYEPQADGSYIMNYGTMMYKDSNSTDGAFMEYKQGDKKVEYAMEGSNDIYKVHVLRAAIPLRPVVAEENQVLVLKAAGQNGTWYQLTGTQTKKVGEGNSFRPIQPGKYFVAVKYGVGYAVSATVDFQ